MVCVSFITGEDKKVVPPMLAEFILTRETYVDLHRRRQGLRDHIERRRMVRSSTE